MTGFDPRESELPAAVRVSWEGFRLAVVPVMVVAALLALALTILALGPFARLGAPSKIGALEGRLFLDELMPLLATALATARWGAGRTAEAAMMQHGGQREALRLLGVSLVRRLHFSGMVGMSLALPALTLWASWAAFLTAALTARLHAGLPLDLFWDEVLRVATPADLGLALLKAMVFGTGVGWMATHAGLASAPGPHGLSRAVSVGVVRSTWMVGVVNLLLTGMWTLR